jgi:hypothetical protein
MYFGVIKKDDKEHWRVSKHKVSYSLETIIHKLKSTDPTMRDFSIYLEFIRFF